MTVEGITTLEITGATMDGETIVGGETHARRFVDWLSVYAQLGFVAPARPIGRASTELRDPARPQHPQASRRPPGRTGRREATGQDSVVSVTT